jgi:hypothetical protein
MASRVKVQPSVASRSLKGSDGGPAAGDRVSGSGVA